MAPVDVPSLLAEISPDAPCGADLSYDAAYLAVESLLAAGVRAGGMVDTGQEAQQEGPNWREIRGGCVELLGRTKDLRVCLTLAVALLMDDGLEGFRDGLALLRGLLERHWEHVWPQLDPDDGYDPLERMNIIASLSSPPGTFQDPLMFRQRAAMAPLTRSVQMGRFGLQDLDAAAAGGEGAPDAALINAAFEDTATEDLQAVADVLDGAIEHLDAIDAVLTDRVGAGRAPDLSGLRDQTLLRARAVVGEHLARRGAGEAPAGPDGAYAPAAPAGTGVALSGDIRSPQDVMAALNRVIDYYERHEPSSPVPLLIRRAQKLVSKSFLEIVQDLSPEILDQMHRLGGIDSM
ncbi:MAG: type VI secretion system protein TssA [Planctomycetes bacterium]|nr:type VI secretion system protein TssA [Planctomycetota bacterium]